MIRLVEISSRIFVRVRVWQTQFDLEHCFLSQCDILSIPAILASENRCWSWGLSCCAAWIVPERGAGPDSSEGAGRIAPSFLPKPRYWLHQGEWPAEFQRKSNSGSLRICPGKIPGRWALSWGTLDVPRNPIGVSWQDYLTLSSISCPLPRLHLEFIQAGYWFVLFANTYPLQKKVETFWKMF